jgi:membrane protease YdiL (CAAX protease family)
VEPSGFVTTGSDRITDPERSAERPNEEPRWTPPPAGDTADVTPEDGPLADHSPVWRRWIALEIVIVLGLGLGRSAVSSILSIIERMTRPVPISQQTSSLNNSVTPDRPWLDLAYQVYNVVFPLFQVLLVCYLLHLAHGMARRLIGFDLTKIWGDLARGFAVAAAIGIPGLAFYLLAREIGINTTVVAANLSEHWWTAPALIASAAMNGILEEVVMLGYLLTRLRDLRWNPWAAIVCSALIRGAYHLYQGFGGFIGNIVMGIFFGWCYRRFGRVMPLVIAHTLIDIVAFVGYALLAPYLTWL